MENNIGHPWIHLHTFGLGPQTKSELSIPLSDCGASGLKLIQLSYWSPCFKDFSLEFYVTRIKEESFIKQQFTSLYYAHCAKYFLDLRWGIIISRRFNHLTVGLTKLVTGEFWTHLGWHWQFLLFSLKSYIHRVHQLFPRHIRIDKPI